MPIPKIPHLASMQEQKDMPKGMVLILKKLILYTDGGSLWRGHEANERTSKIMIPLKSIEYALIIDIFQPLSFQVNWNFFEVL